MAERDPLVVHAEQAGLVGADLRAGARGGARRHGVTRLEEARRMPPPAAGEAVSEVWG